jgi:hypothetical protein
VGYFRPEDCDDMTTPCEYVRFPQFDTLAERYAAVDTSDEANLVFYERMWDDPAAPSCPSEFPELNSWEWPSDSMELLECPLEVPVYCLGIPAECNSVTVAPAASDSNDFRLWLPILFGLIALISM